MLPLLQRAGSRTLMWPALSYVFTNNFSSATLKVANIPDVNIVQSYVLVGCLILFALFLSLASDKPGHS